MWGYEMKNRVLFQENFFLLFFSLNWIQHFLFLTHPLVKDSDSYLCKAQEIVLAGDLRANSPYSLTELACCVPCMLHVWALTPESGPLTSACPGVYPE